MESLLALLLLMVLCVNWTGFAAAFPQSSSRLIMIYLNHTLNDGENVPVWASGDETRKEALVTCITRRSNPHQSLVFQFYAQNSILLEPKDSSWVDKDGVEGLIVGRRRVLLEKGGYLKLQCALTSFNTTHPAESVSANFTFAYRDPNQHPAPPSPPPSRPRLWPIPANSVAQSDSNSATPTPRQIPPPVMNKHNMLNSSSDCSVTCSVVVMVMCVVVILGQFGV